MFGFPKNPPDRMIFEAAPGLFFEFRADEDCWVRVDGLEVLGLATVTKDGLMSPEDFNKLNGLIIPPPQSTLKGEECKTTFTQGKVRLTSTDASLTVSPNLQLLNKQVGYSQPWFLHENTAGYDFELNFDAILTALKQNGKFTQVQIQGRQGLKGDPGLKNWTAFMDKYFPEGNKADTGNVTAYITAKALVQVLKQCGDNLTRENVMRQAANLRDFEIDMLLDGIKVNTSPTDYFPVEELQMRRFNGEVWELFGPIMSGEIGS